MNIQEKFLESLKSCGTFVTAITINGYQMRGKVVAQDQSVIVLSETGKQMMVYKTALSTITPDKPVEF